jgi:hypothetical protein
VPIIILDERTLGDTRIGLRTKRQKELPVNDDKKIYTPSHPLPSPRSGVLTKFDLGTRTLKAGFKIAPQFKSLPIHIVFEKDVAVKLRDGVTIYVDVQSGWRRCPSSWRGVRTAKAREPP